MSQRHLQHLFRPASVAVIGASDKPRSVGGVVIRNLLQGQFSGPVMPVNPKYAAVAGILAYPDVTHLPVAPDLAVICTPPATVPALIGELGRRGTRAAIVLTAGLSREMTADGRSLQQAMLDAARPHLLRILGPNCIGLLVPGIGLNASFAHESALDGRIAFVSQSGALCTIVLDWARSNGIGFSHFISLGDSADIDFGDVIDYLASDGKTRAILLYMESVKQARKFMSAARAAARNKPVVAVKSGRVKEAEAAAASHTGALAGGDDVFSAALRRAGILRVDGVMELFEAVETLSRSQRQTGGRLAILTNGGGPGVMAVDDLIKGGGTLASLSPASIAALNKVLPETWSHGNPVDIIGDAPGERYAAAIEILAGDEGIDAILAMHAPTAIVPAIEAARAVVQSQAALRPAGRPAKNLLTCWLGLDAVAASRRLFAESGLPTYETPESATRAFMQMIEYRRIQEMLMETPPALPVEFTPDIAAARRIIERALAERRSLLSEPEAKGVLQAYGIPVVETVIAKDAAEATCQADRLGYPVALKILSPDISHKSDLGGVVLDLEDAAAVDHAAQQMLKRIRQLRPNAAIEGFTVQKMARRPRAHELIVGLASDPIFGPFILFGQGGTSVEVVRDRAVALPPLNMGLAAELISQTRVSRLLQGYRNEPRADLEALSLTLVKVSQLVIDLPEVSELDINPLYADADGVLALDARIKLAPSKLRGADRLAISPYPQQLEEWITLKSGRKVLLRPIRPEDEPAHLAFFQALNPEDVRFRFFNLVRELPHSEMARFTQIDYDREMAFIAEAEGPDGKRETLAVVRTVADPDNQRAEFAIVVRSDLKGQGIGHSLLAKMIAYCKARGTRKIVGQVLRENQPMRELAQHLGFRASDIQHEDAIEVELDLAPAEAPAGGG